MKNLIVVGDSFCAGQGWPQELAELLNLNLVVAGYGGHPWWACRHFLHQEEIKDKIAETDTLVFVHTFAERIPFDCPNEQIANINKFDPNPKTEVGLAVKLYYKYLENAPFAEWAQQKWFEEINKDYANLKTVHLHGFPSSLPFRNLLGGVQVLPDLTSISIAEIYKDGAHPNTLHQDTRPNHFSTENNSVIANQLYKLITDYSPGDHEFNLDHFQLT